MLMRFHHAFAAVFACAVLTACGSDDEGPVGDIGLEVVQGPPAEWSAGDTLPESIVLRVVDEAGSPRSGQTVGWNLQEGGGSLEVLSSTSDAEGLVSARWVLGPRVMRNRVSVQLLDKPALILETRGAAFQPDEIAAGLRSACAIKDQQAWCWSSIFVNGDNVPVGRDRPVRVFDGVLAQEIEQSDEFICVIDAARATWCRHMFAPVRSPDVEYELKSEIPPARALSAGDHYICALTVADSTPWCWHDQNPTNHTITPPLVTIAAGNDFGCGITADSTAWCWGNGPLGNPGAPSPTPVAGALKATQIIAGGDYACLLTDTRAVYCWGEGWSLGRPGPDVPVPTLVPGIQADALRGGFIVIYATRFGSNTYWGLEHRPTLAAGPKAIRAVELSVDDDACALDTEGDMYCTLSASGRGTTSPLQSPPGEFYPIRLPLE